MSVVGLTFGNAANAIRPSAANAASVPTSATIRASGWIALVPGEPGGERDREDRERAELPAHALTSAGATADRPTRHECDALLGGQCAAGAAEDPRGLGREVACRRRGPRPADPSAIRRPSASSTTRSANAATNSGSCVATSTAASSAREQRRELVLAAAVHPAGRLVEAHDRGRPAPDRPARSRARAAASPRPTGRVDGGRRTRGRQARRSRARRPTPPARRARGRGSRSGSGAAARPGPSCGPSRASDASARRRGAAASTCRRRFGPSARRARRGRPTARCRAGWPVRGRSRARRGRARARTSSARRRGLRSRRSGAPATIGSASGSRPRDRSAARAAFTPAAGASPRPDRSRAPGVASSGAASQAQARNSAGAASQTIAPAAHRDRAVGEAQAALESVLGDHDRRVTVLVEAPQQRDQLVAGDRVELRRRLVEQDQLRPARERRAERDSLELAT